MSSEPAESPPAVPRAQARLTTAPARVAVAASALVVGMVVAATAGGVNWLIGVGGAGAAVGTLGLAYFTFLVSTRTNELADSSQRLEIAATNELAAALAQAEAAIESAREAVRSRIDVLAPIVDLQLMWDGAWMRPRGGQVYIDWLRVGTDPDAVRPADYEFEARLLVRFQNHGRTPAFATLKHSGAAIEGQPEVIRIEPGGDQSRKAAYRYVSDSPFDVLTLRYEFEVNGALTSGAVDAIAWSGEVRSAEWLGRELRESPTPLKMTDYRITRNHGV